jgi:hypothetical protein
MLMAAITWPPFTYTTCSFFLCNLIYMRISFQPPFVHYDTVCHNITRHNNFNSQNGSSIGSVGVHSLTLSYTLRSMKCDSRTSFVARTFASPWIGHKPKARVATLWMRTGKPSCEQLDCPTSPLGVEFHEENLTRKWEKFTWLCLCKSPYGPRGKFFFHLTYPNTSSPSKCGILDVYEEPRANLTTTIAICHQIGSPYIIAIHSH